MSKRLSVSICVFLLMLVFTTCLVIKPVHAQGGSMTKAYEALENVIGGLFGRFSENPAVWMRLLILIGLFAVLFFGASKLGFQKNIAGVIAMVIAIMASIGIPDAVLMFLAQTYGAVFQIILVLLPGIGMAWLTWTVHRRIRSGWAIVGLVFVWLLFIVIITTFADTVSETAMEMAAAQQAIGIVILGSGIIIGILVISGFMRMGWGWGGGGAGGGGGEAETPQGERRERAERAQVRAEEVLELREIRDIGRLRGLIRWAARRNAPQETINRAVTEGRTLIEQLRRLEARREVINRRFEQVARGNPNLERNALQIDRLFGAVITNINALRTMFGRNVINFTDARTRVNRTLVDAEEIVVLLERIRHHI